MSTLGSTIRSQAGIGKYLSPIEQLEKQQAAASPSVLTQVAGTAYQWSTSAASRFLHRLATPVDPSFQMDDKMFNQLMDGLPPEYADNIAESRSFEEATLARNQALDLIGWKQQLSNAGWKGQALQLGVSFVDPGYLAVGTVTGGAGPMFAGASRAGRLARMAEFGLLDATASTALAVGVAQEDPEQTALGVIGMSIAGFGALKGAGYLVGNKLLRVGKKIEAQVASNDANTLVTGQPIIESFSAHSPRNNEAGRRADVLQSMKPVWEMSYDELKQEANRLGVEYADNIKSQDLEDLVDEARLNAKPSRDVPTADSVESTAPAEISDGLSPAGKNTVAREASAVISEVKATEVVHGDEVLDGAVGNLPFVRAQESSVPAVPINDGAASFQEMSSGTKVGVPPDQAAPPPPPPHQIGDYVPDAPLVDAEMNMASIRHAGKVGSHSAVVGTSKLKSIRIAGMAYLENVLGYKGVIQQESADRGIGRLLGSRYAMLGQAFREAEKEIRRTASLMDKNAVADELFSNAGRLVRQANPNPSEFSKLEQRVANEAKKWFAAQLDFAKRHGVKGAMDVPENENYLPRIYNFRTVEKKWGDLGDEFERFMAESLKSGAAQNGVELTDAYALKIAKGTLRELRQVTDNQDPFQKHLDPDRVASMLRLEGASEDEVARAVKLFASPSDEAGTSSRFKRRITFDENYEQAMSDGTRLRFDDLLENDLRRLTGRYNNSIVRASVMAKANARLSKSLGTTIESLSDLKKYAAKEAEQAGLDADQFYSEFRPLEVAYENLMGAKSKPDGGTHKWLARLRSMSYIGRGGFFGVAAAAEFGNVVGEQTVNGLIKCCPVYGKVIGSFRSGKVSDQLLNEALVFGGAGYDEFTHGIISRVDDSITGGGRGTGKLGALDRALDKGVHLMGKYSGLAAVDRTTRHMAVIGASVNIAQDATAAKLALVGIDSSMHQRILDQIKKYPVTHSSSGKDIPFINIGQWDDVAAANAYIQGVGRWASRTIIDGTLGSRLYVPVISPEWSKTALQFRQFTTMSYEKGTLYKAAALRRGEMDQGVSMIVSMGTASLAYMARTHLQSVGMSSDEREQFLADRLSNEKLGAAAFAQAGFSSIIPMGVDTALSFAQADPIFAHGRNSQLGGNIITGNPTYDLLVNQVPRAASGALGGINNATIGGGTPFDRNDAKAFYRLAPFHTLLPVPWLWNELSPYIPESE